MRYDLPLGIPGYRGRLEAHGRTAVCDRPGLAAVPARLGAFAAPKAPVRSLVSVPATQFAVK